MNVSQWPPEIHLAYLKAEALELPSTQVLKGVFFWHIIPAELQWAEDIFSQATQQPQGLAQTPRSLINCLRIFSARISLLLTLPHLRLQFLLWPEATSIAGSPSAKVYSNTPVGNKINDSYLWSNSTPLGHKTLRGQTKWGQGEEKGKLRARRAHAWVHVHAQLDTALQRLLPRSYVHHAFSERPHRPPGPKLLVSVSLLSHHNTWHLQCCSLRWLIH